IVLYLGIVASAITFFLWNYALSKMDASKASVFLFLGPVIVIIISWLFMGEVITIHTIIGSVLVLFGVYLTERQ
ncbi:MAG: EamA family transporter, partial [Anaerolineae bacterium]